MIENVNFVTQINGKYMGFMKEIIECKRVFWNIWFSEGLVEFNR